VTFEDMAVDFTQEEWTSKSSAQRNIHNDVMVKNYKNLATVGETVTISHNLTWIRYLLFWYLSPLRMGNSKDSISPNT
jgi:hypothetical protein